MGYQECFFSGYYFFNYYFFQKEIIAAKDEFHESQDARDSLIEYKPSRISSNDNGTLIKCQVRITFVIGC